jgi:HEAT repeat protein/energy-coupling factor transporter ATP-binding protein EcfA2
MPLSGQSRKTYLDAILLPPPNRRSWRGGAEFYTPTQALPLKAQFSQGAGAQSKAQTAEQPKDRQDPKLEAVEVLKGLGKYALEETGHVLLIGKPGSGKSTALQQLLRQTARQALEGRHRAGTSCIPVLIELRGVSPQLDDVWSWIQAAFEAKGVTVEVGVLKSQRLLLLFDGLNEATPAVLQALDQFLRYHNVAKMPVVCTTRQLGAGADLGIQKWLKMLPLSDGQMRQFVGQRFRDSPRQAEVLLRQLGDRLRELAETPLLLQMLCDVCAERGEIPANRGELFRREFRDRYARFKKASMLPNQDLVPDLLGHLAGTMMQGEGERATTPTLELYRDEARRLVEEFLLAKGETSRGTAAAGYLKDLLANHLLQEVSEKSDYIKFHHQLFQEYYAAEWLLKQWSKLSDEQRKCHYLNYLKWTEPIALMMGLLEDESTAMRVVKLALDVDLSLGARLAGEVDAGFQEKTIVLVSTQKLPDGQELPNWLKIELLGKTRSKFAVPKIRQLFDPKVSDSACSKAIDALKEINSETVISALLEIFETCPNEHYRRSAVESLIGIGTSSAISELVKILESRHEGKIEDVIKACREVDKNIIRNTESVPLLAQLTKHHDSLIRAFAVAILGLIGSEAVVPYIIDSLGDKSLYVRREAINVLSDIGDSKVTFDLLTALSDQNAEIRECAIEALFKIGDSRAIPRLIECLSDPEEEVRSETDRALSVLNSQEYTQQLIKALKHPDLWVRRGAATGLGQCRSEQAIMPLLKILQDPDDEIQDVAQESLINLGNSKVVPELLNLTAHQEPGTRFLAIQALGNLGSREILPQMC